jgi:hypothetical protein
METPPSHTDGALDPMRSMLPEGLPTPGSEWLDARQQWMRIFERAPKSHIYRTYKDKLNE